MKSSAQRISATVLIAAAGLLPAACGQDTASDTEVAKIDEAVNEGYDLALQLTDAINRLSVDCMAEQGFDVHPLWLTRPTESGDADSVSGSETPDALDVPTLADAQEQGFGTNVGLGGESGDTEEADPYDSESEEYRKKYETALYGEAYYEFENSAESGEMPLEEGCTGEVSEAVYGEPTVTEDPDGETSGPHYGPLEPLALVDIGTRTELYDTETMMDAREKLLGCVEDAGYPYFEYDSEMGLGLSNYADGFYVSNDMDPEYELPKGAPWDFEEAFAAEIEFATAVAQCADDTGFRETSQAEWDKATATVAINGEEEIYAWRDALETALGKAQDLIGE